jgi:type II secretory ATPase GspE/PulE/Tfp pilus assembly ATPase PilB-like protein/CheY-like chemotaxis protein
MERGAAGHHWLVDLVQRAGLQDAQSLQVAASTSLADAWEAVARHCGLSVDQLAQEVADAMRLPLARLAQRDPHVLKLVPEKLARRFQVVPMRESDRQIVVACADPMNDEIERGIAFASGRMPIFEIASPVAVAAAIERAYGGDASAAPGGAAAVAANTPNLGGSDDAIKLMQTTTQEHLVDDGDAAPVVKLTNIILRNAAHERASDIHFEPAAGTSTVRFRVDGVMRVHMRMPTLALQRVVSRIKVMGSMDIADRLRPQDGRASFEVDGQSVDLRISTVPTREAEKCVIRLLRGASNDTLTSLQLSDRDLRLVRSLIGNRNGVVVVTGPTGSGKTTTLYSIIRELNNGETNISTVEDPIEYELPGITQMQVEAKRDFTFATALRAILRQDPDVILVGEIRDAETATIAVQASMTGHLVLTTLHTNDASSAVARLVDIGVERPAISATLRGVIAQRLVRRVCTHCAERITELNEDELQMSRVYGIAPTVRARGCTRCGNSGYLGRLAVLEILTLTPALQQLITNGATAPEISAAAVQNGMRSLRMSALNRVAEGLTTLQEVERVVGEMPADAGAPAAVAPAAPAAASAAPTGPRVLVVDDDSVIRKVAKRLLVEGGYDVVEATSGEDALAVLATDEHIALTVLDLGLPGIQGEDVLRQMRASASTASLPVIVLTGSIDPDLEVRLMEEGADDYIRKPIEAKRFVTRVKAALRRAAAA